MSYIAEVLILLLLTYLVCRLLVRRHTPRLPLPPGPTRLPIVGNAFGLPKKNAHLKYLEWGQKYASDIVYLDVLGTPVVILNTAEVALDLLVKRGAIYSDRAASVMGGELVGFYESWGFMRYGKRQRQFRRLSQQSMNARATERFRPLQQEEARHFARAVLQSPGNLIDHIKGTTSGIMLRLGYGYSRSKALDEMGAAAEKLMDEASEMMLPGRWLVDAVPVLKYLPEWFPGASFKRRAAEVRAQRQYVCDTPYQMVKDRLAAGLPSSSICATMLEADGGRISGPDETDLIKLVIGSLYPPGQETTASIVATFFLLMASYPNVQSKAQAQVAAVVGNDRLPDFSDQQDLPYVVAIVKEVLRWEPPAPLGVPHRLMEDDEYKGQRIPKGSVILPNIWAMMHNEAVYPDPFEFRPERFMATKDTEKTTLPTEPAEYAFGFGRRVCPGSHLAEASLFIIFATVLATCRITKCRDQDGVEVPIEARYSSGIVIQPESFPCAIKPLSENAVTLLQDAIASPGPTF